MVRTDQANCTCQQRFEPDTATKRPTCISCCASEERTNVQSPVRKRSTGPCRSCWCNRIPLVVSSNRIKESCWVQNHEKKSTTNVFREVALEHECGQNGRSPRMTGRGTDLRKASTAGSRFSVGGKSSIHTFQKPPNPGRSADRGAESCDWQGGQRTGVAKSCDRQFKAARLRNTIFKSCTTSSTKKWESRVFVQLFVQFSSPQLPRRRVPQAVRRTQLWSPSDYFLRPRFFCCPSPVLNLPCRRRLADVLPHPRWPIFVPSSTTHAQKLMQTPFCEPKGNFGLRRSSKRCHCCLQTLGNHLVTSTHRHSGSKEWPEEYANSLSTSLFTSTQSDGNQGISSGFTSHARSGLSELLFCAHKKRPPRATLP